MHPEPLHSQHESAVERLLDTTFGQARHLRTAAVLRRGSTRLPDLSFILEEGPGDIVGALQSWPVDWVRADGLVRPLVLVGPLVVRPEVRGTGVGRALLESACAALDRAGHSAMLIGDAPYYGRFGFAADATGQWRLPGPVDRQRLLLRARHPEAFAAAAQVLPAGTMLERGRLRA
jgi:predicted N-acetyltransferase YhbS